MECYSYEDLNLRYHMNWHTTSKNLARINAKQIVLTHMGANMLGHIDGFDHPGVTISTDGMVIDI